MNKSAILFITAITAISLAGCRQTSIEVNQETANTNANSKTVSSVMANSDANLVNNAPENTQQVDHPTAIEVATNKVGKFVRTGKPGIETEEMKNAVKKGQYIPGPESSLISGDMNKQGQPVQTRKFTKDQTLDKVEIIALGETERKILVHLRNGKVLPLEQGKITDPMTASSYDLLKAVGIEPKVTPKTNNAKKEDQK